MTLGVEDEIAAMRRRWPEFETAALGDILLIFSGTLAPLRRPYQIRVVYSPRLFVGRLRLDYRQPHVEVMSPSLVLRHPRSGELVPHVYGNDDNPERPRLCLYDPAADEWRPGNTSIADTIIPWAAHWLACYEGWLATGEWTGGGRHPSQEASLRVADANVHRGAVKCAAPPQKVARVGRMTGTYGSRAVLAYVAAASADPLETPEWHFLQRRTWAAEFPPLPGLSEMEGEREG